MNLNNFNIPDRVIYQHASSNETYKRGLSYSLNHRVLNFNFDPQNMMVEAVVRGTQDYEVAICFDDNGRIEHYVCDCPAYYSYFGACKHVVAVMKKLKASFLIILTQKPD